MLGGLDIGSISSSSSQTRLSDKKNLHADWRINKQEQVQSLKKWLDHQIAMRNRMIEESEYDSGIYIQDDTMLTVMGMGEPVRAIRIVGIDNLARILNGKTTKVTVANFDEDIKAIMYEDYLLYDRIEK